MLITGISTDSRGDLTGKLFIPLKGERVDGHDFIERALEKGAIAALSERENPNGDPRVWRVDSTLRSMHTLAAGHRNRFDLKIVAVTGSAGKTTTKDLIASVLEQKYKTLKTQGNLNNEIGLPQTVFGLDESHEAAVLEMGMNHRGEIHNLSVIARPDIAVITNIGTAHIEYLGSRLGILEAKAEIFDGMDMSTGIAVLNGDDPYLRSLTPGTGRTLLYGLEEHNPVRAVDIVESGITGVCCRILMDTGEGIAVNIPLPGRHMIYNALAAAAVGYCLGLSLFEIKKGIEEFLPSANRMEIMKIGEITLINDVYNANPDSMTAALDVLAKSEGYRTAILGDMLELGEQSATLHREVGEYAARAGIDRLIAVGNLGSGIWEGYGRNSTEAQLCLHYPNKEVFIKDIGRGVGFQSMETVLVKASRGMEFEYIKDALIETEAEAL